MKSNAVVDGHTISTLVEEFESANTIEVEVGTNGYQGGDFTKGSRTYFRIKDLSQTEMRLDFEPLDSGNKVGEVTITLGGDSELETFLKGLRFAVDTLERQIDRRRPEVRLTNEEVGILLQMLQPRIDGKKCHNGEVCRQIKEKLERRFE